MNIEILANSDDSFKIVTAKFGEQIIATDGERVSIGVTEETAIEGVKEMQDISKNITPPKSNAAPLDNSKGGHPFNPFGGTSWDDGKRGHKF